MVSLSNHEGVALMPPHQDAFIPTVSFPRKREPHYPATESEIPAFAGMTPWGN